MPKKKAAKKKITAPRWPPPEVIEKYAALAPDAQTAAIAFAIFGEPFHHSEIQYVLGEVGARDVAGRTFSAIRARDVVKRLVQVGWLEAEEYGDLYLGDEIINPLLEIAARNGRLGELATRYLRLDTREGADQIRPDELIKHARLAFFLQDWQLLETLAEKHNRDRDGQPIVDLFVFLSPSPLKGLIDRLPESYRDSAIWQIGHNLSRTQTALADFLPLASRFVSDHPERARFLSELLYFRGDIGRLHQLHELLAARPEVSGAAVEAKQIAGAIAFLSGDDQQAIRRFHEALEMVQRSADPGQPFLGGYAAVFFLLALARDGDHGLPTAKNLARTASRIEEAPWSGPVMDLAYAFKFVSGEESDQFEIGWEEASPVDLLTIAWVELWTEMVELPDMRRYDRLMFDAEHAADNGYLWLAAELYELASRYAEKPHDVEAREAASALRVRVAPGYQTAADTIRVRQPWEKTLAGIEQLAQQVKPAKAKRPRTSDAGRLVWIIEFDEEFPSEWELYPLDQKQGKSGKWNKPRSASPKRLLENPPAYIKDADRRAIARLNKSRGYGHFNLHAQQDDAIVHLIDHPLLFLDPELSQPVELSRRDTQLVLQPSSKDEIYLRLDPAPTPDRAITLTRDTPSRLFLTETSAAVTRLQDLFGADGMTLPIEAKERLLKAVTELAGEIEIQSQIGGAPDAQVIELAADPIPQLHLIPHGEGLSAELLVQPIPEFGRNYLPGSGAETAFAKDAQGDSHQAKRDLELESANARQVIDACPSLSGGGDSPFRWTFPDPASCLELLTELHHLDSSLLTLHWPKGVTFKLKAELETKQLRMALKSEKGWFRASGEIEVDDQLVLSMHELLELADHEGDTGRFIQLKDGQFIALSDEFQRRLRELKAYSSPAPGGTDELQINELAAHSLEELTAQVQLEADQRWREHIARLETAGRFEAEVPRSLRADLRPYQLDGFRWLAKLANWGVGACLADDMGLGKTVQALALLLHRARGGPALVVAPTSVATNWEREAARFAPTLNVQRFGPGDRAVTVADLRAFDLVICTFGLMQIENRLLAGVGWHTVVIDEAQAIKNSATKRAKAALKLKADFRIITTGTPIENNLGELHALFQFINPGLLGSREKFHRRFADPIQKTGNPSTRRWLKKLISPFILRRLKHEVLEDLPPRTEVVLEVEMSEKEKAFYEAIRQRAVANLATEDINERGIRILAEITRLRRACCNPKLVAKAAPAPESSKLAMFAETLENLLEANHKVLVFSQFVDHLKLLRDHLERAGITYQYLDGSTGTRARQAAIDAFQSGDGDVFLISLKAGGTGLNLTAADYVIHMDPWWNPASEDQASDRAHRIGQLRPVTVYRLVTKDTIEEKIVALHHEKRDLASSLLEGTDTGRSLNPEELLALIRG